MELIEIQATSLQDAWFQTLYKMIDEGHVFKIDRGSYAGQKRLEFDHITIRVAHPYVKPLLPQIPSHYAIPDPVAQDYLDDYLPYLMTAELKEGESYTYGQRLCKYPIPYPMGFYQKDEWKDILIQEVDTLLDLGIIFIEDSQYYLNQIELICWIYKNKGYRNNQMVLQVAHPSDMVLQDPPCLRSIDTRIQDGKLHFFPYFRSWDLWGGFPANLGGIQLLKEYMAAEIGVDDGEIIAASKGLHIYDYTFDIGKCIAMKDDMKLKEGSF